jgi:solute:Na+ symporter, SSS family
LDSSDSEFSRTLGIFATNVLNHCFSNCRNIFVRRFDKRTNRHGAFWTLMIGTGLGVLAFVLQTFQIIHIHYTLSVGIMVGISAIIFEVISRLSPAPTSQEINQLTYYKGLEDDDEILPLYLNYKLHRAILMVLIFVILIWLR